MSSVDVLREFVNERLTAAAEEIFRVFQRTVVEYEEEIDRQRRLLDAVWKPAVKLHRIELPELPQHYGRKEGDQEGNSSLDQEDPEPPRVKEEHEELCTTQDGAHLVLKLETATFMLTPHHEGSGHSNLNPEVSAAQTESVVAEPNSDQLLSHNSHGAESQDQKGGQHEDCGSSRDSDPEPNNQQHNSKTNNVNKPTMLKSHRNPHTSKKSFRCDTCGKYSKTMGDLERHLRVHTGERPYSCDKCGKRFTQISSLNVHRRVHTGEKPHVCKICGKCLGHNHSLQTHMRIHTGEKPYSCQTCGKHFRYHSHLADHRKRVHSAATFMLTPHHEDRGHSNLNPEVSAAQTESVVAEPNSDQLLSHNSHGAESQDQKGGQHEDCGSSRESDPEPNNQQHNSKTTNVNKPTMLKSHCNPHTGKKSFRCDTCGKYSRTMGDLERHVRVHTGERPYSCDKCGKRFAQTSSLNVHRRVHTGEKPHVCKICGKCLGYRGSLLTHMRIHTGEMPYSCQTCGKHFRSHSNLAVHRKRVHSGVTQYICKNCRKTFLTQSEFRKHVRAHNCK